MNWFWKKKSELSADNSMRMDTNGSVVRVADLSHQMEYKCRICMDLGEADARMCAPCACTGSVKYIHVTCLKEWIKEKRSVNCELCNHAYKKKVACSHLVDQLGTRCWSYQERYHHRGKSTQNKAKHLEWSVSHTSGSLSRPLVYRDRREE